MFFCDKIDFERNLKTMSNVIVITTSLRAGSNSDILADHLIKGARDAGHHVEHISLKGKNIRFCIGCLACQRTQQCIQKDDAIEIAEKVKNADTLVFSTPIYYYGMSGQMKTLLDRLNPLYRSNYKFRKVYLLATAAEDDKEVPENAVKGLRGWVDCFEKAEYVDTFFSGGVSDPSEVEAYEDVDYAYEFGWKIL